MPDRILREGRLLGNYRLKRLLGQGGFAEVYLAEHIHLGTLVAIKLLHAHLDATHMQKFSREARLVASLRHPHIITITDFGVQDEVPYLVMDYAPGGTLRQQVPKGSRLAPARVLEYLTPIGKALDFAHHEQVVHRDVKPENMLLGQHNEILLSDFGIATVVDRFKQATPTVAGTASYMAPEQLRGRPQPASDQYALAVVAYEWLCGTRPFRGTFAEVMSQHLQNDPPPLTSYNPAISPELEEVILIALSKSPAQRFPSLGDFLHDFALTLRPPRRAASPPPTQRNTRPASTHNAPPPTRSAQPHIKPPLPEPTVIKQPDHPQIGMSRRTILATLGGLTLLGGGGTAWWLYIHQSKTTKGDITTLNTRVSSTNNGTVSTNVNKSLVEQGTTFYTYRGHTKNVLAVSWSPKDNLIVSGSLDKTVQVWHATTGSVIYSNGNHTDQVNTVAWSPNGAYIASGSDDKKVHILDSSTGSLIRFYAGHQDAVNSLAWSPDGLYIASGSSDNTVQVWEALTGKLIHNYTGHSSVIGSVAWSPDGNFIASGSSDNTIQVWKFLTSEFIYKYTKHSSFVSSVVWSTDQQYIASGSVDKTVQVWSAFDGVHNHSYQNHKGAVYTIAHSPDGSLMASGSSDRTVQIWNFSSADQIYIYSDHTDGVRSLDWSPDGQKIVSGGDDSSVKVWQAI